MKISRPIEVQGRPVSPWRAVLHSATALCAAVIARLGLRRSNGSDAAPSGLSGPYLNKGDGPPDLDELWRDFNKKLSGLFGGKGGGKADMAMAGGTDTAALPAALASVSGWVAARA